MASEKPCTSHWYRGRWSQTWFVPVQAWVRDLGLGGSLLSCGGCLRGDVVFGSSSHVCWKAFLELQNWPFLVCALGEASSQGLVTPVVFSSSFLTPARCVFAVSQEFPGAFCEQLDSSHPASGHQCRLFRWDPRPGSSVSLSQLTVGIVEVRPPRGPLPLSLPPFCWPRTFFHFSKDWGQKASLVSI